MNTKHTSWLLLLMFVFALTGAPGRAADDEQLQNLALSRLYAEVQALLRKHYPSATSHLQRDNIHFEQDTQVFLVHELLMAGDWQSPIEEREPKSGGILCDMTLRKGKYQGSSKVPQTIKKPYSKILLMGPYSSKQDAHLEVHLSYPKGGRKVVSADFLKQFTELVKGPGPRGYRSVKSTGM